VTIADGWAPVETTLAASTEVADVDEFSAEVAALAVGGCVEFDSVSAGFDVVCSAWGAEAAGGVLGSVGSVVSPALVSSSSSVLVGVGAVDILDSVVLV
jgi:hypothetical protein